jgi:hypothetical protein
LDAPQDINRYAAKERINSGLHIYRRSLALSLDDRRLSAHLWEIIDIHIEFACLFNKFVLLIVTRRFKTTLEQSLLRRFFHIDSNNHEKTAFCF